MVSVMIQCVQHEQVITHDIIKYVIKYTVSDNIVVAFQNILCNQAMFDLFWGVALQTYLWELQFEKTL